MKIIKRQNEANVLGRVVLMSTDGTFLNLEQGAFDELITAELTAKVQLDFPYNINTDIVTETNTGNGDATQENGKAIVSTTATTNSSSQIVSRRVLKYDAGQGGLIRLTAIFTLGVAGSQQEIGYGDSIDGLFFGYVGADFGVIRRQNGTDFFTKQSDWNGDKADGSGGLPKIDFTKGNVFQIRFQWLGFGLISFFIEHPNTGDFHRVHDIRYANANFVPSIFNPSLPLRIRTVNTTNNTNIEVQTSSMAGFIEGREEILGPKNSKDNSKTGIGDTETNILTIRNKSTFASKINRVAIELDFIGGAVDGTKNAVLKVIKNTTLGGTPSYTDISTNTSVVEFDTGGTTISGGQVLLTFVVQKVDSKEIDVSDLNIDLLPNDTFTISAVSTTAATTDVTASFSWIERF